MPADDFERRRLVWNVVDRWTFIGAVNGFLAVAFGAFGAHGLKGHMSAANAAVYETAAHYHLTHALALFGVGVCCALMPKKPKLLNAAGWLFTIGIVLFSGSLYALAVLDKPILGAITPFGGLCFLSGWVLLALAAFKGREVTKP